MSEPEFAIGAQVLLGPSGELPAIVVGHYVTLDETMYECAWIWDGERRVSSWHSVEMQHRPPVGRTGFNDERKT